MRIKGSISAPRLDRTCPQCGKVYQISVNDEAAGRRRFCTQECFKADRASGKGKLSLICPICGIGYQAFRSQYDDGDKQTCGKVECTRALQRRPRPQRRNRVALICQECGKEYEIKASQAHDSRYCGEACQDSAFGKRMHEKADPANMVTFTCEACGSEKTIPASWARKDGSRFCSRPCAQTGQTGDKSSAWKGGRYIDKDGYVHIYQGSRHYPAEHRVIAEKELGVTLTPDIHIHHDNRERSDNQASNLVPLPASDHTRLHALEKWGKGDRWAHDHDACAICGHTDRPHRSHGRCERCDNAHQYRQRRIRQGLEPPL